MFVICRYEHDARKLPVRTGRGLQVTFGKSTNSPWKAALVFTGAYAVGVLAALGMALRAAGHGLAVRIIQFIKARKDTGEMKAAERLGGNFEIIPMGAGFVKKHGGTEDDRARAQDRGGGFGERPTAVQPAGAMRQFAG